MSYDKADRAALENAIAKAAAALEDVATLSTARFELARGFEDLNDDDGNNVGVCIHDARRALRRAAGVIALYR